MSTPFSDSPGGQDLRGALPIGTRLRGYELISILGQGGFGITYRARDTTLERDVAIKEYLPTALALREDGTTVVPRSTASSAEFVWGRDRFVDEARTLARLDHAPAVVRVYDFLEANGTAYMVMALVEGETLDRRLRRDGPLSPEAIDRLLHRVLDGLEQIHGVGFVHRDIKPANIIVNSNGDPTLVDFGASRAALAGHSAAMTAIFTPGYAAAEQFTSAKQGPWTDIYGLSATLYDAITGAAPPSAFDRMLDDAYVPLGTLRPAGFAPALLAGIDAGLAVRVGDRPQSIATWRQLLSAPADSGATVVWKPPAVVATPALPSPRPAPPARRRLGLYAGVATAVLALAAGGTFMLAPQRAPQPVPVLAAAGQEATKADEAAAEKQRLEAQRKADVDAQAKAAADAAAQKQAEDAKAQAVREQEAAKQEAARKEADRQAAQRQEAERQEAERQEAERQRASAEAAAKVAAAEPAPPAAASPPKAEEAPVSAADKAAAEAAETALRLSTIDRERIQLALTSLGYDTHGADGALGPRSREMIAAWQKAARQPATGFLNSPQYQALLHDGAPALSKFDEEQKRRDDEKKAVDEARAKAAAAAPPPPASQPAAAAPPAAAEPQKPAASAYESKTIRLSRQTGKNSSGCRPSSIDYGLRVYPDKLQFHVGGAWRVLQPDAAGDFKIAFQSLTNEFDLQVTGNMRTHNIAVQNTDTRCVWSGTF